MAKTFDLLPSHEDSEQGLNRNELADPFSFLIRRDCKELPWGKFLGLAAGDAASEIALAQMMHMSSATLVDNHPVKIPGFNGEYVKDDILDFMKTYSGEKFGLVSAFGIEYMLGNRGNWAQFWNGIGRITRKGSIVAISPWEGLAVPDQSFHIAYADINSFFIAQRTS